MVAVQTHHVPDTVPATVRRSYGERISWMRLLTTTALFSIATGAMLVGLESNHAPIPTAAPVVTAAEHKSPLGLRATTRKEQVDIRWDHDLVAALKSTKGLMKITEGNMTKLIPLDLRDLQDGYVSSAATASDVWVQFEVTRGDGTVVAESTRVVVVP